MGRIWGQGLRGKTDYLRKPDKLSLKVDDDKHQCAYKAYMFGEVSNAHDESGDNYINGIDDIDDIDGEVHNALVSFAEDALDLLYEIRETHPDAIIDDKPIDDCIAQLKNSLAEACRINAEYEQTKRNLVEMRAYMIYTADLTVNRLFFSHAAWLGHLRPAPRFLQGYFDAKDARNMIDHIRFLLPYHHNN